MMATADYVRIHYIKFKHNTMAVQTSFAIHKLLALIVMMTSFNTSHLGHEEGFGWLEGTWTIDTGRGIIVEEWQTMNGSTLSGKSAFVQAGRDTVPQESMVLSFRNGQWTYTSTVEGQNNSGPVTFKVIFNKGTEFICENPGHDFPQRIAYRRVNDKLFASIEGRQNGRLRKENFDFVKVNRK
jgi:hypothetical protein